MKKLTSDITLIFIAATILAKTLLDIFFPEFNLREKAEVFLQRPLDVIEEMGESLADNGLVQAVFSYFDADESHLNASETFVASAYDEFQ